MISKNTYGKKIFYFLLSYFIIWIILFEFIVPSNNFLPKPLIVLDSFGALWIDYHLLRNFISSVASIYVSIIAAYYLLRILNKHLINEKESFRNFIFSLEWFSKYVPGIVLGFLLIYWFPHSEYTKYFFILIVVFNTLFLKHINLASKVKQEYIDSALSLGVNNSAVADKVVWKSLQPDLMNHIYNSHIFFWTMLIIFEFANNGRGFGYIFRNVLEFQDLSALIAMIFITGIIIFLGSLIMKFSKNKFFYWSSVEH